jgi:hypothetical protein
MVYLYSGTFACPEGYAFFYLLLYTPEIVITHDNLTECGQGLRKQAILRLKLPSLRQPSIGFWIKLTQWLKEKPPSGKGW